MESTYGLYHSPQNRGAATIFRPSHTPNLSAITNRFARENMLKQQQEAEARKRASEEQWKMLSSPDFENTRIRFNKYTHEKVQGDFDEFTPIKTSGNWSPEHAANWGMRMNKRKADHTTLVAFDKSGRDYVQSIEKNPTSRKLRDIDKIKELVNEKYNVDIEVTNPDGTTSLNPAFNDNAFQEIDDNPDTWDPLQLSNEVSSLIPDEVQQIVSRENGGIVTKEIENKFYELDENGDRIIQEVKDAEGNVINTRYKLKKNPIIFNAAMSKKGVGVVVNKLYKDKKALYDQQLSELRQQMNTVESEEEKQAIQRQIEAVKSIEPTMQDVFYDDFLSMQGKYNFKEKYQRIGDPFRAKAQQVGKLDEEHNVLFHQLGIINKGGGTVVGLDEKYGLDGNGNIVVGDDAQSKMEIVESPFDGRSMGKVAKGDGTTTAQIVKRTLRDEKGRLYAVVNDPSATGGFEKIIPADKENLAANILDKFDQKGLIEYGKRTGWLDDRGSFVNRASLGQAERENIEEARLKKEQVAAQKRMNTGIDEVYKVIDGDWGEWNESTINSVEAHVQNLPTVVEKGTSNPATITVDRKTKEIVVNDKRIGFKEWKNWATDNLKAAPNLKNQQQQNTNKQVPRPPMTDEEKAKADKKLKELGFEMD